MKLRNGNMVDIGLLVELEGLGWTETRIAGYLGLSRMGLWKVRKRLGYARKKTKSEV